MTTVTFAVRKVEESGREVYVKAEWFFASKSFNLFVTAPDLAAPTTHASSWEATGVSQPPNVQYPNWYERAVAALTDVDADAFFTFLFSEDEDVGAFKWKWRERPPTGSASLSPPVPLWGGNARVGVAKMRRRGDGCGATTLLGEVMRRNEALRGGTIALTRDVADLRRALDFAHDEMRFTANARERAERDTYARVVLLMNAKKRMIRKLEEDLEAARAHVDDLGRFRDARGGTDEEGDSSDAASDKGRSAPFKSKDREAIFDVASGHVARVASASSPPVVEEKRAPPETRTCVLSPIMDGILNAPAPPPSPVSGFVATATATAMETATGTGTETGEDPLLSRLLSQVMGSSRPPTASAAVATREPEERDGERRGKRRRPGTGKISVENDLNFDYSRLP